MFRIPNKRGPEDIAPTLEKPSWTEQGVVSMASWPTWAAGSDVCQIFSFEHNSGPDEQL